MRFDSVIHFSMMWAIRGGDRYMDMKRNIAALLLAGSAAAVLSGCASRERVVVDPYPSPHTLTLLSESAARAAKAQEDLARIQAARTPPAPKPLNENMDGVPAELRRPVTIQWSGPGEEAARRFAALIGYSFATVGQRPATPPMVSISYVDWPAAKVYEDLGLQSAPFAQVVLDARTRRVEYRFLPDGSAVARRVPISK